MNKLPMNTTHLNRTMLIISGPTAAGKSDFALEIAQHIPSEIINMDMAQMYTALSIGTAKPEWASSPIVHHLFDSIDTPRNYTVVEYRKRVLELLDELWSKKKLPIVVGGAGFYLKSLFFPPDQHVAESEKHSLPQHDLSLLPDNILWNELFAIDPARAQKINKNDRYRIERALLLWHAVGKKPSECTLSYMPPAHYVLLYVTRERKELYQRIDQRVIEMMRRGWADEVRDLLATDWCSFVQNKKIIGYNELIDFLTTSTQSLIEYEAMIAKIQQRSRHYAKRQDTFWRSLYKQLSSNKEYHKGFKTPFIQEVCLSEDNQNAYVESILSKIHKEELGNE